jgi:hypothetical protein
MEDFKAKRRGNLSMLVAAIMLIFAPGPVNAAPCPAGLVIRQASPGDLVCATPESKRRAAADNARAPLLWVAGPYGPKTCATGYVWRQAFASDLTCVTPDVRSATLLENNNPRGDPQP